MRSVFDLLYWVGVECPLCGRAHGIPLYRDDLERLANAAGDGALDERLRLLSFDRPLVRCPACVVRWGGEAPSA